MVQRAIEGLARPVSELPDLFGGSTDRDRQKRYRRDQDRQARTDVQNVPITVMTAAVFLVTFDREKLVLTGLELLHRLAEVAADDGHAPDWHDIIELFRINLPHCFWQPGGILDRLAKTEAHQQHIWRSIQKLKPRAVDWSAVHGEVGLAGTGSAGAASAKEHASGSRERRKAWLAFLSPRIQMAILEGRHPEHLTLERLLQSDMPVAWNDQERLLGFTEDLGQRG